MYTIKEAKEVLKDSVEIYLQKDKEGNYEMDEVNRLPLYLEGSPGIGKTEVVKQVADELGIGYVSFSLTHHTRNSLLGLPVIRNLEHGKYTEYTMSEIIARVLQEREAGAGEGILLIDEFSCVSDSIMPAMLAFLQTKNIGMHALPEGWILVLCGNPPQYNHNARRFDAAVLDRVRMIKVEFDAEVFLDYAQGHGIHQDICSYLRLKPTNVYQYINDNKNQQLVTCRGWMNLSHALYGMEHLRKSVDEKLIGQFIKSGEIAHDFFSYYNMNRVGICERDLNAILNGRNIDNYITKYMDYDISLWWNVVDVFADLIQNRHKEIAEDINILKLAEELQSQLQTSSGIHVQIENRLHPGNVAQPKVIIPLWNRYAVTYTPCSDLERELLEEWFEMMDPYWNYFDEEEADREWLATIEKWKKTRLDDEKKELTKLSREISNVFHFLQGKDDMLTEKFYQVINHSEMLLYAMTKINNKDYLQICKNNYAVGV